MGKSMEVSNIREFEMKFFYVFLFPETFLSVEKASMDEVDAAHKQYMAALASLYLKHHTDENVWLLITWSILLRALYAIDKMLIIAGKWHMF